MKAKLPIKIGICLLFITGYGFGIPTSLVVFQNAHSTNAQVHTRKVGIGKQSTMAVLWSQVSAEKKALYFQGYNIGKKMIDQSLSEDIQQKRAIVLDIDETVLDNSPYFAYLVKSDQAFPFGWDKWVKSASAKPLPGAKEFLNYVNLKNIDIYYVSNRMDDLIEPTIKNLKEQGFPQINRNHVILQSSTSNKGPRIQQIKKSHMIVCLFGDNLGDFIDIFNGKGINLRNNEVENLKTEFGERFIVFPNPMYGDWEWTMYHYNIKMASKEKMKIRSKALLPYNP